MNARNWTRNARGEWYVLAQAALMLLVLLLPGLNGKSFAASVSWTIVGVTLSAAGFLFVMLGSVGLGRNLSPFPRPKPEARLVESGVFSLVRHPIYTGLSLLALGWSSLWMSWSALTATIVLFLFFDAKARREERWLQEKFGAYEHYKVRVRKLIPFIY